MLSYSIEFTRIPEMAGGQRGVLLQIGLASVLNADPSLLRPLLINHARKRRHYMSSRSLENYITKVLS